MPLFQRFGRQARRVGSAIHKAIFGTHEPAPRELAQIEREQQQRRESAAQAGRNAEQASNRENLGREQAARARIAAQQAAGRGDLAAAREARKREQEALDYALRQRLEKQSQQRKAHEEQQKAEQALRKQEQLKAKAREALLRTRARLTDEEFEEAFSGPRPAKREYRNIKTGLGDIPSEEYFVKLGVRYSAFASSNVRAIQFDPTKQDLFVLYIRRRGPDAWYQYIGVGPAIAKWAYEAASKGVMTWDALRIRGTQTGNRFVTRKGVSPPSYLPIDPTSSAGQFVAGGGGF